jgi:hypothetical protein
MNEWLVVALGITIVLILTGFVFIFMMWKRRKEGVARSPNYRVFFILGCVWIPVGLIFIIQEAVLGIAFIGLGLAYMAIGLANKDKWK